MRIAVVYVNLFNFKIERARVLKMQSLPRELLVGLVNLETAGALLTVSKEFCGLVKEYINGPVMQKVNHIGSLLRYCEYLCDRPDIIATALDSHREAIILLTSNCDLRTIARFEMVISAYYSMDEPPAKLRRPAEKISRALAAAYLKRIGWRKL